MALVSDKVKNLPPYLFSEFQRKKQELEAKGVQVIDLGIGAPDLPTPDFVIQRLVEEVQKPENHRYPPYSGCQEFREAVAYFYKHHYQVELDPDTEVLALIGSKEGIANLFQAVINPGDYVLVPNPSYPVYKTAVHLAGGNSVDLPLDAENGYVPLYDHIDQDILQKAKLMLLNYPSNPTTATVDLQVFEDAIAFAKEHQLFIAHDSAYDLVTFGDYQSPSILQAQDAKEYAVEFGSLSKSFNMTGWRIGFVVGNKDVIKVLSALKSNIDSGQFLPIQMAAATALTSDLSAVKAHNDIYEERMNIIYDALTEVGIKCEKPRGTIFMWAQVPDGHTSRSFSNLLLEKAGIIVTPGSAFGDAGEGYFRVALSVSVEKFKEVAKRLKQLDFHQS